MKTLSDKIAEMLNKAEAYEKKAVIIDKEDGDREGAITLDGKADGLREAVEMLNTVTPKKRVSVTSLTSKRRIHAKFLTREMQFLSIDNVRFKFKRLTEKHFHIERVYIMPHYRGKGLLTKALRVVVSFADEHGLTLSANFLPDAGCSYEPLYKSFGSTGFLPLQENGETYRNDVTREPLIN